MGLKGAEAIGGGIKTIFQLENGFDVDSGRAFQGGLLFGRQAYVGVSSDTLGALTAGRQYDAVVDFLAQNTAGGTWGGYMFAHPYDSDNLINTFRTNNAVKYTSPALGGLKFGATYGFSNDVKASNNRLFSVGGQYTVGGWLLSAAYLQADHPSATSYGAINNGGDQNLLGSRLRIVGAGATYTWARRPWGSRIPMRTSATLKARATSVRSSRRWGGCLRSASRVSRSMSNIRLARRIGSARCTPIRAPASTLRPEGRIRPTIRSG